MALSSQSHHISASTVANDFDTGGADVATVNVMTITRRTSLRMLLGAHACKLYNPACIAITGDIAMS